jgi:hypothetical protein
MSINVEPRQVAIPIPKNWDPAVTYSPWIVWDPNVPEDIRKTYVSDFILRELVEIRPIQQAATDTSNVTGNTESRTSNEKYVTVTSGQQSSDSAQQQYGLFAKVDMPKGAFLGEYVGRIVHEDFLQKEKDVALYYCSNKYGNFYIDASSVGNETRFIRVVKEEYNMLLQMLNLDGKWRAWFEIIREIKSGEELTVAAWTCRFFGQPEGNILPRQYQHINHLVYDSRLSEEVVSYLEEVNTLEALVEIRIIQDPSHPCNGQRGLFALRDLPSGIFIGEYCGIAIHQLDSEGLLNNQYLADYDNMYHNYAGHIRIDAQNIGNETRYINDFRGIKDSNGAPNARFNKVWLDRMRCMVEIIDFVPKDKEITVDYGEQYWSLKRHLLTPSYRNLMQSQ